MKTITYTEFAKMRNVSRPMISKYIRRGIITRRSLVKVGARLRILPDLADDDLNRYFKQKEYEGLSVENYDDFIRNLPDIDLADFEL